MNAADLFGIGGAWTRSFRADPLPADRQTLIPDVPVAAAGVTINTGATDAAEVEGIRDRLRAASTSLRDALTQFARETTPVYTTGFSSGSQVYATARGVSARVDPYDVAYQVLAATQAINTSTARASSSAIGLDTTAAASTFASTAEMNAAATSLDAYELSFQNSTSKAQISGAYTGTATSLTIKTTVATDIAIGGAGALVSFDVLDQTNAKVASFSGLVTADQTIELADIGLKVRFSAGSLRMAKMATVNVTQTPTSVDTAALFNAGWASGPRFENFQTVAAGSFTVNGTSIAVAADDSIDSVISRINASGAGVTAAVSGDRITLSSSSSSEAEIVVGNDTSGFLAATKLSGATTTLGNVRDDLQALAQTSQFSGVVTGSFSVNGVSISVDRDTDTLQSVLARINGAGAGVTASYDSATDAVTITPDVAGATLTIENDTSGFLAAVNIATGSESARTDPTAAFNAAGASAPLFDGGMSVTAGSFTVNGVTITVAADDSVNSVLAKITASAAGVTAAYDAATDSVTLTANDYGGAPITVGADTSGFLAAVKLDGTAVNTTAAGSVSAFGLSLGSIAEYAGVTAGTLTVNGQDIAIDPATMTVRDLAAAIDAVDGVTATLDETSGALDVRADFAATDVTLADTSGILAALGVAAGTVEGELSYGDSNVVQTGTTTVSNASEVAADVSAALGRLNGIVSELAEGRQGDAAFEAELTGALQAAVDLLRDSGVRGFDVKGTGEELRLAMSRDTLVSALNGLGDHVDLDRALAGLADGLDAGFAAAAGWEAPPSGATQTLTLGELSRAQLAADQTQASLLYAKASLEPHEPEEMTMKAALKAYGG